MIAAVGVKVGFSHPQEGPMPLWTTDQGGAFSASLGADVWDVAIYLASAREQPLAFDGPHKVTVHANQTLNLRFVLK
jgi:hypothetical protein